MKKTFLYIIAVCLYGLLAFSCARTQAYGGWPQTDGTEPDTLTREAALLTMVDRGNYTSVEIADPWKPGSILGRYALVPRTSEVPEGLPSDAKIIRTPVERAAVYSSVHTSPMDELEALGSLVAVADGSFFGDDSPVAAMIRSGAVADVGSSMSPSVELIAQSQAEVILLSPMEGISFSNDIVDRLGIVSLPMADYMELSPLARAEWIKLLGELFGKREGSRKIYDGVAAEYDALCRRVADSSEKPPVVLTETEYSGVWYVPAGGSYMARMLGDAGAVYPWARTEGAGSLSLGVEQVLEKAGDADVWLVKTFGYDLTPEALVAQNPLYSNFKAVASGGVYYCNTAVKPFYNDIAFHPERILADLVAIFHPDVMSGYEPRYFNTAS